MLIKWKEKKGKKEMAREMEIDAGRMKENKKERGPT